MRIEIGQSFYNRIFRQLLQIYGIDIKGIDIGHQPLIFYALFSHLILPVLCYRPVE